MLERTLIKLDIAHKVVGNRQHYLRWDSAQTPSVLEYADFKYDSTGSYADMPGFRFGICYEFSMFDFLTRKKLNIKQRPLIVMEDSIISNAYMGLGSNQKAVDVMRGLKAKCINYDGDFALLWHNSSFNTESDKVAFEKILERDYYSDI
jgi:hypothetical protein